MKITESTKEIENAIGSKILHLGILKNIDWDTYYVEAIDPFKVHPDYFKLNVFVKNNSKYTETAIEFNKETYYLNPKIIDEMYLWYKYRNERIYNCGNVDWTLHQIKLKTATIIDSNLKKKILQKSLLEENKKLKNNSLAILFLCNSSNLEVDTPLFENFIKETIFTFSDTYEEYLNSDYESLEDALFNDDKLYEMNPYLLDWIQLINTKLIIDYINNQLVKLNPIKTEKNKADTPKDQTKKLSSKYPLVFPDLDAENHFLEYLKVYNALDDNNNPVKSLFKPLCNAYYTVSKDLERNKLENYPKTINIGRNKVKFYKMLNQKFKIKKPINKLSDGSNYTDFALKFITGLKKN